MTRTHQIALLPGDGIGGEVIDAGMTVLDAAGSRFGFELQTTEFDWNSERYGRTGAMMPDDGIETLRSFDAIYLGAVGSPDVPDHETLWGLLLPIRQKFDQYVNLRPVRMLPGVSSPLAGKNAGDIDMVCVRENSEGEYSGVGGRVHETMSHEVALQVDVFTREGVERIVRYAFDLAMTRRRHLTSITKSNAGRYAFVFWDEVVEEVASDYPDVEVDHVLVDAAAAFFVSRPESFDVVVGSNLFMDILTDIGAAVQGGMGFSASANINPGGDVPAMFEPVHGSAPDIAGRGISNPIGAVWAGSQMLNHLGETEAEAAVMDAVEAVLTAGEVRTPDMGGDASTSEFGAAIAERLSR
ncbi:MAG: tartrate dehydrogenase [Actinomycetota bacterium]|nr:tartrate dehydrogenase [Actinomycetota bacterium]